MTTVRQRGRSFQSSEDDLARVAQRCREAALRYLAYRPRSAAEVRARLARQGYPPETIEATLGWLEQYALVDDRAFAEFWVESRQQGRPSSQRLIRAELLQRGVPGELARTAVDGVDDEESAYRAAARRAVKLSREDEAVFRRRLRAFLERRGFDYDVIARTVERIWRETPVS